MKVYITYSDGRYEAQEVDQSASGKDIVNMSTNLYNSYKKHALADHKWQHMLGYMVDDYDFM